MSDRGGIAARRVMVRWAWRMFRRDWRQQVLIVALVTFAVAVAAFGVCAAYNVVPTAAGDFGSANHRLRFRVADVDDAASQLVRLDDWFDGVELIGHRNVHASGAADGFDLRAQDPRGRFSGPMLALRTGRYPNVAGEVAITDGVAERLGTHLGDAIELDHTARTVVGFVENPARLDDEFILESHAAVSNADALTVLMAATPERVADLPTPVDLGPIERRPACHATLACLSATQSEQATAGAAALGLATVLLLLVALVAASGFVVVAQRRQRQLGLLAANGATQRHLRLVVLTNGALVGSVAALTGGALGTLSWIVSARWLEGVAGHRIDRLHLPLWLLGATMVLATVISVGAAWSPARLVARVPVMTALSARPPRPKPVHRSAIVAITLMVLGVVALSRASNRATDNVNAPLLVGGLVALVIGVVFLSPAVLGALGRLGTRTPIAPRIALRDLARYRARSSAALAAVTLGLALPVGVIVIASQATHRADEGNLSDRQLIFRIGDDRLLIPERTVDQLDRLQAAIDGFAATIDASVLALDVATDPAGPSTGSTEAARRAVVLGREIGSNSVRDLDVLYVATTAVIARLGLAPSTIDADADVLTPHTGSLAYANTEGRPPPPSTTSIARPPFSSMPTSLLTPSALARNGWTATRSGWLLDTKATLSAEQRRSGRDFAASVGLTAETRDRQHALATIVDTATAVGFLLALGILALTVGLLRGETARELPILAATGATSTIRRTVGATTAGALATTGVLLGTVAAYTALAAGYHGIDQLGPVPVRHLGLLLVGIPAITAIATWLLAGSNPPNLTQSTIE